MAEDPDPSQYLIVSLEQKRKDQTKPYDGKKMVWVPDDKECFLLGDITSTKGDLVTVQVKGEEVTSHSLTHCVASLPLCSTLQSFLSCLACNRFFPNIIV